MWINPTTQQIYATHSDIRSAFPQVSLPSEISDVAIAELDILPLTVTEQLAFNPLTQTCIRDGCELVEGQWQYKWRIDDLTPEQIAENEATYKANLLASYVNAITAHLDAVAQTRNYDNRITCSVRAAYPGPFQAEGIAFGTWMDNCNATGYKMVADYEAWLIPLPTIAEMIASLPPMVWPT